MRKIFTAFIAVILCLSLVSCSAYRPILDRNEKFLEVGEAQSDEDVKICRKEAEDILDQYKVERAAKEAGRKAVIGGVVGAASGAIWGRGVKSALAGGAVGALVGAAVGGLSVAGEDKVHPDQMKQRYMVNCLGRKGYAVLGWR
jgi:uncharacterized protein YcfJ